LKAISISKYDSLWLISVFEMDALDAEVERVRMGTTAANTRKQYERAIIKMILWFASNSPDLINDWTSRGTEATSLTATAIQQQLRETPFVSPLNLDMLNARHFERYVVSSSRADGHAYSKSTYDNMRSSLVYLYQRSGRQMSAEFSQELTRFYKGLNRRVSLDDQNSNDRLTSGKEPLQFWMYEMICTAMLQEGTKDCVFAHLFLTFTWNLICRAGNASSIRFAHMTWREDALAIYFAHMKNDQEGERPRDARHIYANPITPSVCPLLSLGIYLVTLGFDQSGRLFPGGYQYDRYGKILRKILERDQLRAALKRGGLAPTDIGSHSARKGAATFVSSCTTAGPSTAAVCLRAGWTMPGVQDTYVRYEAAGDQVVGRFVSGLPYGSSKFAILPPYFTATNERIEDAITSCFPTAPTSMRLICEYALATMCYHADFLRQTLPTCHPVFECALFRHDEILNQLRHLVVCRERRAGDRMHTTGIPPHVALVVEIDQLRDGITHSFCDLKGDVRTAVLDAVRESSGLEYRDSQIVQVVERTVANAMGRFVLPQQQHPAPAQSCNSEMTSQTVLRVSGDRLRRVPEGFTLCTGSLSIVWQYWCCGDDTRGHPPYRFLQPRDMSNRSQQKRLAELRRLLLPLERAVRTSGIWKDPPTATDAAQWLADIKHTITLSSTTPHGRQRRLEQLSWHTLVREIRHIRLSGGLLATTTSGTTHASSM
jgi:hypothetical protein